MNQEKSNAVQKAARKERWWLPARWWLSLGALFVFLVGVTFLTYALARSREALTVRSVAEADAIAFSKKLQEKIDEELRGFRKLKWNKMLGEIQSREEFLTAAREALEKHPYILEIGCVDPTGERQWAVGKEELIPKELDEHLPWYKVQRDNKRGRDIAAVWLPEEPGKQMMALYMPLSVETDAGRDKALVARVMPEVVLKSVIDEEFRKTHDVEMREDGRLLLRVGEEHSDGRRYSDEQVARFANRYWRIRVRPTAAVAVPVMGLDRSILVVGILASCLITASFFQILRYRAREVRQAEHHMSALESLNQISIAISGKLGCGQEIMQQLAESARKLMGMRQSIFTLLDAKDYCMRMYSSSGELPAAAPKVFPLEQMPTMRRCLKSGHVLFAEDTSKITEAVNRDMLKAFEAAAMIMIPLKVEGRSIGIMVLSDSQPRKFSDADRRLAHLLGSQATVILANHQLYEQMREGLELQKELHEQSGKDAQAKAILLRELHHRVKNNLAGIVGLLSMHEPDLPPSAASWLERVRERIQTMARAHDLFSGGIEKVNLRQLVEQVLPSLSVLTPPGVAVKVNTSEVDIYFDTSRAVSLAMVLHELCTNALVHGLDGKGTLTISTARTAQSAVIEVSDDGGAIGGESSNWIEEMMQSDEPEMAESARWEGAATTTALRRGTGLYLVRELVRRELKGTLRLRRRSGGGTIATIELPLDATGMHGADENKSQGMMS